MDTISLLAQIEQKDKRIAELKKQNEEIESRERQMAHLKCDEEISKLRFRIAELESQLAEAVKALESSKTTAIQVWEIERDNVLSRLGTKP